MKGREVVLGERRENARAEYSGQKCFPRFGLVRGELRGGQVEKLAGIKSQRMRR
jgi:hypothetical protein